MKKDSAITEKEKDIRDAIIIYLEEHQYPPTIREICDIVGLKSTASVHRHLTSMLYKGIIESDAGMGIPRSIRVPGYVLVESDGLIEKDMELLINEYRGNIKTNRCSIEYAKGYLYGCLSTYWDQNQISMELYHKLKERINGLVE